VNPSFYAKCVENAYFLLPSKFEMKGQGLSVAKAF
jgi:hypothetical protein